MDEGWNNHARGGADVDALPAAGGAGRPAAGQAQACLGRRNDDVHADVDRDRGTSIKSGTRDQLRHHAAERRIKGGRVEHTAASEGIEPLRSTAGGHRKLLIVNRGAGSVTPELVTKLRRALPQYTFVEYGQKLRMADLLAAPGRVVVAGGDGAVSWIARQLLHSQHSLGILPAGTYNNFAIGLGIPADIGDAVELLKSGRPRPVSVGRVNGEPFLEAAVVGRFGEMLQVGHAASERDVGELRKWLAAVVDSPQFRFTLSQDLKGHGVARTLFFANTPSVGARIRIADGTPRDAYLELSLGEAVLQFRRMRLRTEPRVRVFADARPKGRTPALIEVDPGALRVVLGTMKKQ